MAAKKSAKKAANAAGEPTPKPAKKAAAKKAAAKKTTAKKAAAAPPPRPSPDAIARGAYLNYRRRVEQGLPGDSHGDWLEAERKLSEDS